VHVGVLGCRVLAGLAGMGLPTGGERAEHDTSSRIERVGYETLASATRRQLREGR
jgi:hypothetical protein